MGGDPNEGAWGQLFGNRDKSREEVAQARDETLAETAIKQALTSAGYRPHVGSWAATINKCQEATGSPKLTFEWFHADYPAFPVQLSAANVPFVYSTNLRDLFDGFRKMPIFKQYAKAFNDAGLSEIATYFGLVFRDIRRLMVLHNYPRRDDIVDREEDEDQGTLVAHRYKNVTYTLERYDRFLLAIGPSWLQDA
jgi:hypothetical protein